MVAVVHLYTKVKYNALSTVHDHNRKQGNKDIPRKHKAFISWSSQSKGILIKGGGGSGQELLYEAPGVISASHTTSFILNNKELLVTYSGLDKSE